MLIFVLFNVRMFTNHYYSNERDRCATSTMIKSFLKTFFSSKKSASNRFSSLSIVAASIMGKDCKTTEHEDDQMTTTTPVCVCVCVCVAFVIKLSVVLLIMALLSHLT